MTKDTTATLPDSPRVEYDRTGADSAPAGLEIFGRELFSNKTTEFSPDLVGPVDPDYRLGPRDELWLILTGDVEAIYRLVVSREGMVIIPNVGQVAVNGLTLRELEDRLYDRLGRVYSGVKRGSDATTRFQLSLGQLRVNQVYVIGEVERPSAYQVSAASTVLDALYLAGGAEQQGEFPRHRRVPWRSTHRDGRPLRVSHPRQEFGRDPAGARGPRVRAAVRPARHGARCGASAGDLRACRRRGPSDGDRIRRRAGRDGDRGASPDRSDPAARNEAAGGRASPGRRFALEPRGFGSGAGGAAGRRCRRGVPGRRGAAEPGDRGGGGSFVRHDAR